MEDGDDSVGVVQHLIFIANNCVKRSSLPLKFVDLYHFVWQQHADLQHFLVIKYQEQVASYPAPQPNLGPFLKAKRERNEIMIQM